MNVYIVIVENDLCNFTLAVNEKIKQGYIPLGGVSVNGTIWYHQAMIKKEETFQWIEK